MTDHPMRSARRHVEEGARREVSRLPTSSEGRVEQVRSRAWGNGRPRRHRAPAFELKPYAVHVAVVVETHPLAPLAVDEEEEGALLPPRPEERGAEGGHESSHARQHLMHLRHVDGGALGESPLDLRPGRPALIAALGGDLHGNAGRGEGKRLMKARSKSAPCQVARGNQAGRATSWPPRSASRRSCRESRGTRRRCDRP